jgi:polysaccharide export outer membrane protein
MVALACLVALGCTVPRNPAPSHTSEIYRVGPPDELLVNILPEPRIERMVIVRPDGFISVDLIGDVRATGRSLEEIAVDIQQKISRYRRDSLVTVSLLAAQSSTVVLFGEVREPGTFNLTRDTRIAEAIGTHGGTTIFSSKSRVRIIRPVPEGQTQVLRVDLKDIQRGDLSTNIMLYDGDIVVVPPNALARVGYMVQTLLFPFQPILGMGGTAVAIAGLAGAF